MVQQRVLLQSKEMLLQFYNKCFKDDIKFIMDNFIEIIKIVKVCGGCGFFVFLRLRGGVGFRDWVVVS